MPNSTDQDPNKVTDKQTGESFELVPESWPDTVAAWVSIVYTLAVIVLLTLWLLNRWTWIFSRFGQLLPNPFPNDSIKLPVYTAIGGGMGAAVNNIRSFVWWHAEKKAFGRRFVWKYVSMPFLGGVLAVMVYAILQGGIAIISGTVGPNQASPTASLSAWLIGALAGYGAEQASKWLDDKVATLFKVEAKTSETVTVPDLSGKTQGEAEQALKDGKLQLGNVSEAPTEGAQLVGKVISQTPEAGKEVAPNSKVDITIGKASEGEPGSVPVPDVSGKTQGEAEQTLKDGELELGNVSEAPTEGAQLVGKVISQTPEAGKEVAPNSKVDIIIGKASDDEPGSEAAKVTVPDVSGKTQEEAEQALKDGKLALGDVSTGPTSDEKLIGKVISQSPLAGAEASPDSKVAVAIGTANGD